jgi:hypothetical protein
VGLFLGRDLPGRVRSPNATPLAHTVAVPTMTIATVAIKFCPLSTDCASTTVSPLTDMTIATTSAAEGT